MTCTDIIAREDLEPQAALLWLLGRADELRAPGDVLAPFELLCAALERPAWLGLTEREAGLLRARLEELPALSQRSRNWQRRRLDALLEVKGENKPGSATCHSLLTSALNVPGPQLTAVLDHRPIIIRYLRTRESPRAWWRTLSRRGRRTPSSVGWPGRSGLHRARPWIARVQRLRLEDWQRSQGRVTAWFAFAAALPGILTREGLRMLLARGAGCSLAYRTPVEAGGFPSLDSWSMRPSARLAMQVVPSMLLLIVGLVGALGIALELSLGVDAFPMYSILSLGGESQLEGLSMLLLTLLSGEGFLHRWTVIGMFLAWLPTYQAINELSWNLHSAPIIGPSLFWALLPVRGVLWLADIGGGKNPVLRALVSGAFGIGTLMAFRAWLRTF